MKRIYKHTLLIILILTLASNSLITFASPQKNTASYDLEKGGTQTFFILNEDGNYDEIIIEEISQNTRIDNGTYKITHKTAGWKAGFNVTISANKITSASSPFHETYVGKISVPALSRNNTTTATYSFVYTVALINNSTGVIASISNSTLTVSKK
jgi:major membrane immunogen (membrane-anchored lipoprotein)